MRGSEEVGGGGTVDEEAREIVSGCFKVSQLWGGLREQINKSGVASAPRFCSGEGERGDAYLAPSEVRCRA